MSLASRAVRSASGVSCVYVEKIPWGWKLHYPLGYSLLDENLSYEEEPVSIIDRYICKLRSTEIASIKVQWKNRLVEEATWEKEADMRERYPHLFTDLGAPFRPCFLSCDRSGTNDG